MLSPEKFIKTMWFGELAYSSVDKRLSIGIVYAIAYENEIIYIGQTTRTFRERVSEHLAAFTGRVIVKQHLYNDFILQKKDPLKLNFKILFESENGITQHDLDHIEQAFIAVLNPSGNMLGAGEEAFNKLPSMDNKDRKISFLLKELRETLNDSLEMFYPEELNF